MSAPHDLRPARWLAHEQGSPRVALRLEGVTKSFPGVVALKNVTLEVAAGEVHAVVGENGAGKSTLMAIAAGVFAPDHGAVSVHGEQIQAPTPARMRDLGLAIVYQQPAVLPDLTVVENLVLGVAPDKRPRLRAARKWAGERLDAVGLDVDPQQRVQGLSVSERHLLEIAKAFSSQPSVLILDEPTEPLSRQESERLFADIRSAARSGVAVIYISHRLRDVERVADRITVLRDGEVRGTFAAGDLSEADILRLIVGRSVNSAFPEKGRGAPRPTLVRVEGISGEQFGPVDLTLRAGEVVGLAGIEGNGQREFLRGLAGIVRTNGRVYVDGRPVQLTSPRHALNGGIWYMPADRHAEGLMLALSVRENMALSALPRYASAGVVRTAKERAAVAEEVAALMISTPSTESPVSALSGGNQQKTVFGRSVLAEPKVLLADEPTQGVDAGARLELYRHVRSAAERGAAVIVLSSDALELEGLCDRVLIFSRGHVVKQLVGDEVTDSNMTHAALTSTQLRTRREPTPSHRRRLGHLLSAHYAPSALLALVVVVVGAYAATRSPDYLTTVNLESYLLLLSVLGFIALGQFVVIVLGGIDLSVGPLAGFLVVVASSLVSRPGLEALLGLALILPIALSVGLSNGLLVRAVRVTPVIATLVTFFVLQGLSLTLRPTPGGVIDLGFSDAVQTAIGFVPVAFIALIAATAALEWGLRYSRFGLELRAVGSDEGAAHRLGVNTTARHVGGYVLCSGLTFLGAVLLMAQLGVGDASGGTEYTLLSIAAVVLGGASIFGGSGSFVGVFCGAVLLQQITNVSPFLELSSAWQYWFAGGLTLVAAGMYSRARRAA